MPEPTIPQEPDWLGALREQMRTSSQRPTAKLLGVNVRVLNHVLAGKYPHRPRKLEAAVREKLMGGMLACPATRAPMEVQRCLYYQRRWARGLNPIIWQEHEIEKRCKTCPNNHTKPKPKPVKHCRTCTCGQPRKPRRKR